jgi:hypothetical protein
MYAPPTLLLVAQDGILEAMFASLNDGGQLSMRLGQQVTGVESMTMLSDNNPFSVRTRSVIAKNRRSSCIEIIYSYSPMPINLVYDRSVARQLLAWTDADGTSGLIDRMWHSLVWCIPTSRYVCLNLNAF